MQLYFNDLEQKVPSRGDAETIQGKIRFKLGALYKLKKTKEAMQENNL